ncbi:transcription termination/antitermination protein NusG [Hymenobacter sp. HDW8]|uniref:transcription termination/antitermination protein NusG n=1 Tax=Hymenobacter sp. HDW8 TaxID=2714932 RepID=UPI0014094DD5|nr:hypothetical protein G7064_16865 [Hymenobacter sp. HDW8]
MNWYILSTKLGYEQKVVKNLTKKYEAYLPLHQLTDEQKGKVLQPIFPGYFFVYAKPDQLKEIAKVKGGQILCIMATVAPSCTRRIFNCLKNSCSTIH